MDLLTLIAHVQMDTTGYEQGLAETEAATTSSFNTIEGQATSFGEYLTRLGKIYIGGKVLKQVVNFGKQSVAVNRQFEASMSQVAATMGEKSQEVIEYNGQEMTAFDALNETAKEYGRTTAFTASQSAEALNYMALAGYDAQTSIGMLPNVLKLAAAGGMDLGLASDMITDTASALGLTIDETTTLINEMAKASTMGNTSVSQLGDAMLTLGATGRGIAGGTVELSAAFTALADNGIKGSEGGTKLRNILLSIKGSKFEKTFGKLGVSVRDAAGELRPLPDILNDMNVAMNGMTTAQKDDLINKTFNRGDLAAVNALLGTSTERWYELQGGINAAGEAAEDMANRQLDNLQGDLTKLSSAMEGFQIMIGEKVTPYLRILTQFATKAIDTFGQWAPIVAAVAGAFGTMFTVGKIMTLVSTITNLGGLIPALTIGLKGMFQALTFGTGPIGLVIAAVVALGGYLVHLYKTNEEFRNKVNEVWANFKEELSNLWTAISSFFTEKIPAAFENAKQVISNWWAGVVATLQQFGQSVTQFFTETIPQWVETIIGFFSTLPERLGYALGYALGTIVNWGTDAWNYLQTNVPLWIDTVVNFFAELPGRIWTWLVNAFIRIDEWGQNVVNTAYQKGSEFLNAVVTFFAQLPGRIAQFLSQTISNVAAWGSNMVDRGRQGAINLYNSIISVVSQIPGSMVEVGRNIVSGLWNGIVGMADWFSTQVSNFFGGIVGGAKAALGIASPSKVMRDEIGKYIPEGIAVGIEANSDSVREAMNDLSELSTGSFGADLNGYAGNTVIVNVYGAEGQDIRELAEIVAEKIDRAVNSQRRVYA